MMDRMSHKIAMVKGGVFTRVNKYEMKEKKRSKGVRERRRED